MRYENWDVLIFPDTEHCRVPLQEFKTSCEVIRDPEADIVQSCKLLPVVTGFIPTIASNAPFRLSIHSWSIPVTGSYTTSLPVVLEARLLSDGVLVGSCTFPPHSPFPLVMDASDQLDKDGTRKKLSFPDFHRELLVHPYWNAADDLGRLKLIISEGTQLSPTEPFSRLKNLVAFSFQHAPLSVLQQSCIAWPNRTMWRSNLLLSPTKKEDKETAGGVFEDDTSGFDMPMPRMMEYPLYPTMSELAAQEMATIGDVRKLKRVTGNANNKRQRTVSAASKAIDAEDEPRTTSRQIIAGAETMFKLN